MMSSDMFFPLTLVVKRIMKMCFCGVFIMIYKNKILTLRIVNLFYHCPVTQKSRTGNKECIVFGRVLHNRSQRLIQEETSLGLKH